MFLFSVGKLSYDTLVIIWRDGNKEEKRNGMVQYKFETPKYSKIENFQNFLVIYKWSSVRI